MVDFPHRLARVAERSAPLARAFAREGFSLYAVQAAPPFASRPGSPAAFSASAAAALSCQGGENAAETQPAPAGGPAGEDRREVTNLAAAAAAALEWVTAQQRCRPSRLLPSEWRLPNILPSESAAAIQAGDRLIRTCRHSVASAAPASGPLRLQLSRGLTRIRD